MPLHWDGHAGWERTDPDDNLGPDIAGPGTRYGVFVPDDYDLYVWTGPKESSGVIGGMGADLRSMERAKHLGVFRTLNEAKGVAEAFHRMGESGPTPYEVVAPLEYGSRYGFSEWPNYDIKPSPAGVYTIWEADRFIYVGMAGRTMGVDPENPPVEDGFVTKPKNPLRSRLNAHASGRRSGDQFCVYVCDRFVVPALDNDQRRKVAEGVLKLDSMTKQYIRERFDYRYTTDLSGYTAHQLERFIQGGALEAGKPYLNPR